MEERWEYRKYEIREGLKPGSSHFQYFYIVSEDGRKKCNYCIWIADDAVSRFSSSGDFDPIISSQRERWKKWVMSKIDAGDFENRVLKIEKDGEKEIDLSKMNTHFTID